MPRNKGNLEQCLRKAQHHLGVEKVMALEIGLTDIADIKYRFGLVTAELETAIEQIEKIRTVAQQHRYSDVLHILNEQIEFGHDFASAANAPAERKAAHVPVISLPVQESC